jgi:hypothetical protein
MARAKSSIEALIRLVYTHWKKSLPKTNEPCPDEETLAGFVDGLLDKKEAEKLKHHLIKCSKCAEVVALAQKMKKFHIY